MASAAGGFVQTPSDIQKPELAQHDSSVLDLAFAMDCTGSMASYIHNAQQNIRQIVEQIVAAEQSDVHLALVQYRDHPPQDSTFVTKVLDFSASVGKMKNELDTCTAAGGGDCPEAVADALHQVSKLSWRPEATKICVLISDAPPHGLDKSGDSFPNGCPDGLDPVTTTRQLAASGVTLYAVGCEPAIRRYKDFFSALAHMTGGQYVPLGNAALLAKVIIGGAQEEITLEKLMEQVNEQVTHEALAAGDEGVDSDVMAARVYTKMQSKGAKAKRLQRNQAELPQMSSRAKAYSEMTALSDVGAAWSKDVEGDSPPKVMRGRGGGRARGGAMSRGTPISRMACRASLTIGSGSEEEEVGAMEEYETVEEAVSMAQAHRMVSKSMARHGVAKKKS